jgi:hypothetical protein
LAFFSKKWSDWPEEDLDEMESTLAVQQVFIKIIEFLHD